MLSQNQQDRIDQLWNTYKKTNDDQARDQLLDEYIPLIKYVAGRMAMNLPSSVEVGDLESFGFFGLLDAVEKFDETRNIKFETYAAKRIRGAILDGLRSMDWVPRSVRSKFRTLENQVYQLTNELGRSPTDREVAAALDVSSERYYELLTEVKGVNLFSLDETLVTDKEGDSLKVLDLVIDKDVPPDRRVVQNESIEELTTAVEALSEREQLVLALYYHEELTLKEIGHVLGVSESRVSQIHTKAVLALRNRLT